MHKYRLVYKHIALSFVSYLFITFSSCQKTDEQVPFIQIEQPSGGSYSVLDSIRVVAQISDNEIITRVSVYVINESNQRISTPTSLYLNQKNYNLNILHTIDNLYLSSGSYYLVVEAWDEQNEKKSYIPIQIGAIERQLTDIIIIEGDLISTKIISIYQRNQVLKVIAEPYQCFLYNPYAKQYHFLSTQGILSAYQSSNWEKKWTVDQLKDPSHVYTGQLKYENNLTFVSNFRGAIAGYGPTDKVIWQANTSGNQAQISDFIFTENNILVSMLSFAIGYDVVEQLNRGTGAYVRSFDINFTPKRICPIDQDLNIVFGNYYNQARACSLSTLYNLVWPVGDFGSAHLEDAFKVTDYQYLVALDHKIIEYHITSQMQRTLDTCSNDIKFFYEPLNQKVFYVDGSQIKISNHPQTGHQLYYSHTHEIKDLIFVYNK